MKWVALSKRERRALIIGALIAVPIVGWGVGARPYMSTLGEMKSRLANERQLLARELGVLEAAGDYPEELRRSGRALLQASSRLMGGGKPGLASANFARYLQAVAQEERVLLSRVDPKPAEPAGTGLLSLTLMVRGESDLEGVMRFLQSLESGPKLVRLENLRIQSAGGGLPSQEMEILSFDFVATAYMLVEEQKQPTEGGLEIEVLDD